jgi:two-component system, LytTR family, response regulator
MRRIKTIVIEDDPLQMEILCDLLNEHFPNVFIEGRCSLSQEGIVMIRENKPDLVILDIDLPGKNGLQMLEELGVINFKVLFITAYKQFALQAHTYDSIGYILKPVSVNEISAALLRFNKDHKKHNFSEEFRDLSKLLTSTVAANRKIAVHSLKEIHYLNVNDIIRLEADHNYTSIFTTSGQCILASKQIGDFEDKLTGDKFYRVHDKHLINLRYVSKFKKGEMPMAVMTDQCEVPVSRRKKDSFLTTLQNYHS